MRKIVLLAALLIAPGMAAAPAAAGERGHHFRHAAPPAFGHHRVFRPPHFGHRSGVVVFHYRGGGFGYRHRAPAFVRPPHVWRPPHAWRPHHAWRSPPAWRPHHRAPVLTFGRQPYAGKGGFAPHRARHHRR